ncbi:MAG: DNA-directed RNA polymerase subunit alpha [Candidatus Uhrbacteria bacterium GW2011_GWE2_45_35]|uniref:DNA-directed RNA polymerase subunit alpha n=2 Tax=Candidatus Uhriibacteriota TaxID=1752732 RepID=A0A0G1JKA4_9BACT|nr:MAG: DNA-directed RNA polymerase subunit alpha [Candidatus Uhrbacteria bacterium GW2011_GWF2_44_350]KKU08739.1 MAG: DNA-directed RNA polymerase subunit alpha [Candidatus Uhrbacteria bacterium GW2011_GWE2_45_35]HBR80753.1 DNA-directed RNA polymerase subunit alpha [Candidatus Uhrbacteria bacterium]HCU31884.1 DNA-directed RNA polymerase subunit alpha [Candidatus Uhrbacteria bacterium]
MENILLPTNFTIEPTDKPNVANLVLEPCYFGYGTTVGNALRRVLLSSLPGAAVTAIKIKGATHEFQAVTNVKEDVLQIILNLKNLRLKLHADQPVKLHLRVKGAALVTAADFEANADVEIVNPELVIATLTDAKSDFDLEAVVERGRGYSSTEERKEKPEELGMIAIDALFSPVRNVGYRVENTRLGDVTNYDKLVMTIETDGTIEPQDAVSQSAKVLLDYFNLLIPGMINETLVEKEPEVTPTEKTTEEAVEE